VPKKGAGGDEGASAGASCAFCCVFFSYNFLPFFFGNFLRFAREKRKVGILSESSLRKFLSQPSFLQPSVGKWTPASLFAAPGLSRVTQWVSRLGGGGSAPLLARVVVVA
jgi:hypothetical protein